MGAEEDTKIVVSIEPTEKAVVADGDTPEKARQKSILELDPLPKPWKFNLPENFDKLMMLLAKFMLFYLLLLSVSWLPGRDAQTT